jgi:hypothetical protein
MPNKQVSLQVGDTITILDVHGADSLKLNTLYEVMDLVNGCRLRDVATRMDMGAWHYPRNTDKYFRIIPRMGDIVEVAGATRKVTRVLDRGIIQVDGTLTQVECVPMEYILVQRNSSSQSFKPLNVGDKVVRGPHWMFGEQDRDSKYGIVRGNSHDDWWRIQWISVDGRELEINAYQYSAGTQHIKLYAEVYKSGDRVKASHRFSGPKVYHSGGEGTVQYTDSTGVLVHWDNGKAFYHFVHELEPATTVPASAPGSYKVGDKVSINPASNYTHQAKGYVYGLVVGREKTHGYDTEVSWVTETGAKSSRYYYKAAVDLLPYKEEQVSTPSPGPEPFYKGQHVKRIPGKEISSTLKKVLSADYGIVTSARKSSSTGKYVCAVKWIFSDGSKSENYTYSDAETQLMPIDKPGKVQISSQILNSDNHVKVQRFTPSVQRAEGRSSSGISGRRSKATVTSGSVSYKEVTGIKKASAK